MLGQAQSPSNKWNIRTEGRQNHHGSLPFLGSAEKRDWAGRLASPVRGDYWIAHVFATNATDGVIMLIPTISGFPGRGAPFERTDTRRP
jgi:hypothetical protein